MTELQVPDSQIMEAIRAGDESAFVSIYSRLQAPIYRFALHMSGSRSVAEDVTQEVFLTLIHRSAGFDANRGTIAAYLMGVARNCLLRRLQIDRGFITLGASQDSANRKAEAAGLESDPLSDVVRDETVRKVREAVVTLPLHYREVLVLCELEEKSYQEASDLLGCAAGTVRSRLHRARELLVQKLWTAETQAELARASSRRCPA